MGQASKIEWTHHTFNPWRGCTKVSAGCAHCYADRQAKRNPKVLGVWGDGGTRVLASESAWHQPLKWDRWAADGVCYHCGGTSVRDTPGKCEVCGGKGRLDGPYRARVFCASMADVFEDRAELASPRERLFSLIDATPNLDWLLLTKRPENIERLWSGGRRDNVWRGTSCEDQANADARIDALLETRDLSPVEFLSCEPLLGPIVLPESFLLPSFSADDARYTARWVIVGGESGPGARPMHPNWARSLRDQCRDSGNVAFHFKQWGEWAPLNSHGDISQGGHGEGREVYLDDVTGARRVGKKAAGRLLDGLEWNELPVAPAGAVR